MLPQAHQHLEPAGAHTVPAPIACLGLGAVQGHVYPGPAPMDPPPPVTSWLGWLVCAWGAHWAPLVPPMWRPQYPGCVAGLYWVPPVW